MFLAVQRERNFPLFASFQRQIWHWFEALFPCISITAFCCPSTYKRSLSFCLFSWSRVAYSLFNDWLTSYKEALHYCMVQQAGEAVLWGWRLSCAHGQDLIMLKSKRPVPCVSARFECMLSSVCVSKLSTEQAQSQHWAYSVSCKCVLFMTYMYNTCPNMNVCALRVGFRVAWFKSHVISSGNTGHIYMELFIFQFWQLQVQKQTFQCCITNFIWSS